MFLKILSYPRALFLAVFILVWTLLCSVLVITKVVISGHRKNAHYLISKVWCQTILNMSGVEVELRGAENLPTSGGLYLFNHTSHYDILVIFAASPRICYFGAKSELFSIPVFGQAIRKGGALPIERKNREKVIQVYRDAEKRVQEGDIFALAPEGTRTQGFGKLGEFKSGPFFFAVNSQMPIVPLLLVGCEKVLPRRALLVNWGVWKQKVIVEIMKPIYPEGRSEEQIPALKNQVRKIMQDRLSEYWQKSDV